MTQRCFLQALTIVGLVVTLIGCGGEAVEDPVILEIGGRPVLRSKFDDYIRDAVREDNPLAGGELEAALLAQFIEEQLLLRAAEDEGIQVEPEEIEAFTSSVSPSVGMEGSGGVGEGASPEWNNALRGADSGDANVEGYLRVRKLIDDKVLEHVTIGDEEVAAYYEEHRAYYKRQETVDISQILVETEEDATRIYEELVAQPGRFDELVEKYSIGSEAAQGGRLGTFRRGELPPAFEERVFALKRGSLSNVVKTDFGYHIFRADEVREARILTLEEVEDAIRVDLLRKKSDEAMAIFMEELRERYPVTVHTERMGFPFVDPDAKISDFPLREKGGERP